MPLPRHLIAILSVLVLAGCGGGSTSGSATGTASGAEIAPQSALAFISINTDQTSDQWKQAEKLLQKFAIGEMLLAQVDQGLSDSGVDFRHDVLPLLGDELDVVVVSDQTTEKPTFVAMTQPTDEQKFDTLLEKGDSPSVHEKIGDWTVFGDTQAELDAFKTAANGGKLADDQQFKDAMGELPGDANAKAYVNGEKLAAQLRQSIPNLGAIPAGENLQWLSVALESTSDGWKIDGAAKSAQLLHTFKPTLLSKVPSGSLVVASFRGTEQAFTQLRDNPQLSQGLAQLQSLAGVSLQDLQQLLAGEGALYVRPGVPFPEVTILLHPKNAQQGQATLDRLASKAQGFQAGLRPTRLTFHGVTVRKLRLSKVAIYWGVSGGDLVLSDTTAPFAGTRPSIQDDSMFAAAKKAAGLPDETAGFLYVNLKDSLPLIESFAQSTNAAIPPQVLENLAPLQSFVAYGTADAGVSKFTALLQVS